VGVKSLAWPGKNNRKTKTYIPFRRRAVKPKYRLHNGVIESSRICLIDFEAIIRFG